MIPMREEVAVGALFKFAGKRNVYRVVEADKERPALRCGSCALDSPRFELQCCSAVCSKHWRSDKKYVYFVKVQ